MCRFAEADEDPHLLPTRMVDYIRLPRAIYATQGRGIRTPAPIELTIADDEDMAAEVALVLTPSEVREGLVSTVTALASAPVDAEATISVSASPGHEDTRTDDYILSANTVLTIPAGGTRSTGTVTIGTVDDQLWDTRRRRVTVSGTVTSGGLTDPADMLLTILEDDHPVEVALIATPATRSEGQASTITMRALAPVPADVTVTVATNGAKAESSEDPVLLIPEGQTESTGVVTLTAIDDTDTRNDIVSLRGNRSSDSQFVYVHTTNTATADEFTVSANRTLTIPEGSTRSPDVITLTASDDTYFGPLWSRSVVLKLESVDGINASQVVMHSDWYIQEDEAQPRVTLDVTPASISENGGQSTVTARINTLMKSDVRVTVAAAPVGTAKAGDFTQTGTLLTIPANSKTSIETVTIRAVDNAVDGPDKNLVLTADVEVVGMEESGLVWAPTPRA